MDRSPQLSGRGLDGIKPLSADGWARVAAESNVSDGHAAKVFVDAARSSFVAPVEAMAELYDHAAGTRVSQSISSTPEKPAAPEGALSWCAAQLGSAVGMTPWIWLLHKGCSSGVEALNGVAPLTAVQKVGISAGSGLLFGAALTPTGLDDSNWVRHRLENGLASALSFTALTGTSQWLAAEGMTNRVAVGVASGLPAGLVDTETRYAMGQSPTANPLGNMLGFSFVGGVFGLLPPFGRAGGTGLGDGEKAIAKDAPEMSASETARSSSAERFLMPLIYKPDAAFANTMQDAAAAGTAYLRTAGDAATFHQLVQVMIDKARPALAVRAESFKETPNESIQAEKQRVQANDHAASFGVERKGGQRTTHIGERGVFSAFRQDAIDVLKEHGNYTTEEGTWGPFSPQYGIRFVSEIYSLQHSFDTPDGRVNLAEVKSSWIPTHEEQHVREPFNSTWITSPTVDVREPMFKAADLVLDEAKHLKKQLDNGAPRDDANLAKVTDIGSKLYWMVSQTWPYNRGSAAVADLVSKSVFDYMDVYTPSWRVDVNPNVFALLKPLNNFQQDYPSLYQDRLAWH